MDDSVRQPERAATAPATAVPTAAGAVADFLGSIEEEVPVERFEQYLQELDALLPPPARRLMVDALVQMQKARRDIERAAAVLHEPIAPLESL